MAFRSQINGSTDILAHSIGGDRLAAQSVGEAALLHSPEQAPAYGTGWAAGPSGGPVQALEFRTDAQDHLELVGAFHSTSSTPAAAVCTLPPAWQPRTTQRVPVVVNNAGTVSAAFLEIQAGGVVKLTPNLAASGVDVYVCAQVPLGNVA